MSRGDCPGRPVYSVSVHRLPAPPSVCRAGYTRRLIPFFRGMNSPPATGNSCFSGTPFSLKTVRRGQSKHRSKKSTARTSNSFGVCDQRATSSFRDFDTSRNVVEVRMVEDDVVTFFHVFWLKPALLVFGLLQKAVVEDAVENMSLGATTVCGISTLRDSSSLQAKCCTSEVFESRAGR